MQDRHWHKSYASGVPRTVEYERITVSEALTRSAKNLKKRFMSLPPYDISPDTYRLRIHRNVFSVRFFADYNVFSEIRLSFSGR